MGYLLGRVVREMRVGGWGVSVVGYGGSSFKYGELDQYMRVCAASRD